MISYERKEMVLDCHKDRIIVIDINSQGILELETVHKRLVSEFPKAAELIRLACIQGKASVGMTLTYEERGYKFLFIVTRKARVGRTKCVPETVNHFTEKLLLKCKFFGNKFVSGILNRDISSSWPTMANIVKKMDVDWVVYVE